MTNIGKNPKTMQTIFKCATQKCDNAVAANTLNQVQLKAIQRIAKKCDNCGKTTKWIETYDMFGLEEKAATVQKHLRKNIVPNH